MAFSLWYSFLLALMKYLIKHPNWYGRYHIGECLENLSILEEPHWKKNIYVNKRAEFYANKFNNPDEMENSYNLPRLNYKKVENLNTSITIKGMDGAPD